MLLCRLARGPTLTNSDIALEYRCRAGKGRPWLLVLRGETLGDYRCNNPHGSPLGGYGGCRLDLGVNVVG